MHSEIRPGTALVLSPALACIALGCGPTKLWALIKAGELEAFLDGNRRRITAKSIADYVARRLAGEPAKRPVPRRLRRTSELAS
jgi:hypothetical protein